MAHRRRRIQPRRQRWWAHPLACLLLLLLLSGAAHGEELCGAAANALPSKIEYIAAAKRDLAQTATNAEAANRVLCGAEWGRHDVGTFGATRAEQAQAQLQLIVGQVQALPPGLSNPWGVAIFTTGASDIQRAFENTIAPAAAQGAAPAPVDLGKLTAAVITITCTNPSMQGGDEQRFLPCLVLNPQATPSGVGGITPLASPPTVNPPVVNPPVATPSPAPAPANTGLPLGTTVTPNGAVSPVTTQPVVTQPVVTQPVVTQPVVTQPVVTQPVVTQPVVTQPVVAPTAPPAPWVLIMSDSPTTLTTAGGSISRGTLPPEPAPVLSPLRPLPGLTLPDGVGCCPGTQMYHHRLRQYDNALSPVWIARYTSWALSWPRYEDHPLRPVAAPINIRPTADRVVYLPMPMWGAGTPPYSLRRAVTLPADTTLIFPIAYTTTLFTELMDGLQPTEAAARRALLTALLAPCDPDGSAVDLSLTVDGTFSVPNAGAQPEVAANIPATLSAASLRVVVEAARARRAGDAVHGGLPAPSPDGSSYPIVTSAGGNFFLIPGGLKKGQHSVLFTRSLSPRATPCVASMVTQGRLRVGGSGTGTCFPLPQDCSAYLQRDTTLDATNLPPYSVVLDITAV